MSTDITLSTSGHSLHGSDAAKRQATAELNFFSYVGDLERCIRIVQTWNLNVLFSNPLLECLMFCLAEG